MPFDPNIPIQQRISMLRRTTDTLSAQEVLQGVLDGRAGKIAMVSSFGADSVVLLHMIAQIDPTTPVLFLDTRMLFRATLLYQQEVAQHLGLTDVRVITPDPGEVLVRDNEGLLYHADTNACCALRKVEPLQNALSEFDGWITGRKRHQSQTRAQLDVWEDDGAGRLKVNPLAGWSVEDLQNYMTTHDLPRHPLVAKGYPSIGCEPCTFRQKPGLDARSGRWAGQAKTECGIHLPPPTS